MTLPATAVPSNRTDRAEPPAADPWQRASQIALIGLFVLALIACAYAARQILVPVILAWVIATVVMPLVERLEAWRVPRPAAAALVTITLALVTLSLLFLLAAPLGAWLGRAAEAGLALRRSLDTVTGPLAAIEEMRRAVNAVGAGAQPALKVEQSGATVTTVVGLVAPAVAQLALFIGALLFYLVYRQRLRHAVVSLLADHDRRLAALHILSDVDDSMTTYFGTFTVVNVCLGVATAALTWMVGLPNPLLWGALAGLLNYVPYLGPATVTATLFLAGLLAFATVGQALVAPLIFLALVTVEGQVLTPALMGRRLEINPFAVFLAIAFCGWLWGPVGAFLAVPLLAALAVALGRALADTKPALPD